nr:putative integron gene cassette protein [uncultured bacterium]
MGWQRSGGSQGTKLTVRQGRDRGRPPHSSRVLRGIPHARGGAKPGRWSGCWRRSWGVIVRAQSKSVWLETAAAGGGCCVV